MLEAKKLIEDFKTNIFLVLFNKRRIPLLVWVILISGVTLSAVWWIPRWQVNQIPTNTPKEQAELEDKFRGTLLTGLSGLFFFVTAYFTYRNLKATEDKQITERFGKAIEQLGSEQITVRIGGIYSLERIAKDSPADHWTVIEVLISFIKEHSPISNDKKAEAPVSNDVQAALTVIGRRNSIHDPKDKILNLQAICLHQADLKGGNFKKADFRHSKLTRTSLHQADLSEADLNGANLGSADLGWTNFRKAHFQVFCLTGADINGADFREVDFSWGNLSPPNKLHVEIIKLASNWKNAKYDEAFRKELGLPQELTE